MRVTMHVEIEFEVGTPRPNDARLRAGIVERFKGTGATDLDLGVLVKSARAYTSETILSPLHLRAIRLPRGAERAPAAYIRFEGE